MFTNVTAQGDIVVGNVPIPRQWKRPSEGDPLKRWAQAVGRGADLATLHTQLRRDQSVAIVGMSGEGKSTLAALFAHHHVASYAGGVLWVELGYTFRDATQCQAILNSWATWAYGGDVQIVQAAHLQFDPDAVRMLLTGYGPLLVVLDDIWDLEAIEPLRRALPDDASIVATTRDARIAAALGTLPLGSLTRTDALRLLRDHLPDLSDTTLERLADGLGRHAQALAIAAGDIKRRVGRERRAQAIDALLEQVGNGAGFGDLPQLDQRDRQNAVEVALKFSYDDIGESVPLGPDYQRRFRALGALGAPQASFGTATAAALWSDELDATAEYLDVLRDRSLVTQIDDEQWALHTLIHAYAHALLLRGGEREPAERYRTFMIWLARESFRQAPQKWTRVTRDMPHIRYVGKDLICSVRALVGDLQSLAQPNWPRVGTTSVSEDDSAVLNQALAFSSAVSLYVMNHPEVGVDGKEWLWLGLVSARVLNERPMIAVFLRDLALWHYQHGQLFVALEYSEQALPLSRAVGDRQGEVRTLNDMAGIYRDIGELQQALVRFKQAFDVTHEMGDLSGEALTLNNMGLVYHALKEPQRALELYERALSIAREVGGLEGEATTLSNMGMVYRALGQMQRALELYDQALLLIREVGDRLGEAATLNNKGMIYYVLGQPQRALELYDQALLLRQETGDRAGAAITLYNKGTIYRDHGQPQQALELFAQALPILREVGNRPVEAATLNYMGNVYHALGQPHRALELFAQALSISRELGDRALEGTTLGYMGAVHLANGTMQRALELLEQALLIWREIGSRADEAATLHNKGVVYHILREPQRALELLEQALLIWREIDSRVKEATTLGYIGEVHLANGTPRRALTLYEQALTVMHEVGDRAGEATTLNNMGLAYIVLEQLQRALELFEQSLAVKHETGDRAGEVATLNNMREVYRALAQPQRAQAMHEQAMAIQSSFVPVPPSSD